MKRRALAQVLIALGAGGIIGCAAVLTLLAVPLHLARRSADAAFETHKQHAGEMIFVDSTMIVPHFFIDKTEVTAATYRGCVEAGACSAPSRGEFCNYRKPERERDPVNCVDHAQAAAFCAWAGRRLPTAVEWGYAACPSDYSKRFEVLSHGCIERHASWSHFGKESRLVAPPKGTCPVDAHPQWGNGSGAIGMLDNVSEWTALDRGTWSLLNRFPTLGGNWMAEGPGDTRCDVAYEHAPDYRDSLIGFRCARDGPHSPLRELWDDD